MPRSCGVILINWCLGIISINVYLIPQKKNPETASFHTYEGVSDISRSNGFGYHNLILPKLILPHLTLGEGKPEFPNIIVVLGQIHKLIDSSSLFDFRCQV